MTGGGALKLTGANDNFMPAWRPSTAAHDTYEDTSILTAKLGLRLEPVEGWSIAARVIALDPEDSEGSTARISAWTAS